MLGISLWTSRKINVTMTDSMAYFSGKNNFEYWLPWWGRYKMHFFLPMIIITHNTTSLALSDTVLRGFSTVYASPTPFNLSLHANQLPQGALFPSFQLLLWMVYIFPYFSFVNPVAVRHFLKYFVHLLYHLALCEVNKTVVFWLVPSTLLLFCIFWLRNGTNLYWAECNERE